MSSYIEPDREHLVALALSGILDEDQTREILESVTFYREYGSMNTLDLARHLNQISDALRAETPVERLARAFKGTT